MARTISTTATDLREIALGSDDARGYFAAMYARVTGRIETAIGDGRFSDGDRMEQFACAFADYYLLAANGTVTPPACWNAAWDVSGDRSLLIAQHLLLGINAHVNHDLALTVVEMAAERGDIGSIRPDFNAVNEILAETYADMVDDLGRVSRWAVAASALGGGDAFGFSLQIAREQAWQAALAMHRLDDTDLRAYEAELDRLVTVLAHIIVSPHRLARPVIWLARRFENRDSRAVVRQLLGETDPPIGD